MKLGPLVKADHADRLLDRIETECGPIGTQRDEWRRKLLTMQADVIDEAVDTVCQFRSAKPSWPTIYASYRTQLDRRSIRRMNGEEPI